MTASQTHFMRVRERAWTVFEIYAGAIGRPMG